MTQQTKIVQPLRHRIVLPDASPAASNPPAASSERAGSPETETETSDVGEGIEILHW